MAGSERREGAENFIDLLATNNVSYIFMNPGSDLIPIMEALAKFKYLGKPAPEVVLCQHESLAMTAAQGYFMASEKPQVVMVHLDVGTQQIGGALHNAQRGCAGIILCAGRPPLTFDGERRGGRSILVDFRTEQFDQASIVRPYVKWDYELRCNDNMQHVVQRAFQVANTEPHGPVYLTFPRELLMENVPPVQPLPRHKYGAPTGPQADDDALKDAARCLAAAHNPLIITTNLGRHHQAVAPFVKLAELIGARVVSPGVRMNFPTNHALWAEGSPNPYLKDADVMLIIDAAIPYVPTQVRPSPDATIICIDIDPVRAQMPTANFPADIRIMADSAKAIPALEKHLSQMMSAADRIRARDRLQNAMDRDRERRVQWEQTALAKATVVPITPEWLAYCLGQVVGEQDILVDEAISYWNHTARHLVRTVPGTSLRSDGSSLGWGLGSALGAKLAAPDRTVVCLTGDGCYLYGHPTATFWTSVKHRAPFLNLVFNNGGYNTMDRILDSTYGKDSYTAKLSERIGTAFTPPPDYAAIARASGAWAFTVSEPKELPTALRAGLDRVRDGQPAVLEVKLGRT
jgi:acetolactate synthase-1/2/3 large subunit